MQGVELGTSGQHGSHSDVQVGLPFPGVGVQVRPMGESVMSWGTFLWRKQQLYIFIGEYF